MHLETEFAGLCRAGRGGAGLTPPSRGRQGDLGAWKKGQGFRNKSGSCELSGSGIGVLLVSQTDPAPDLLYLFISFNPQSKLAKKLLLKKKKDFTDEKM